MRHDADARALRLAVVGGGNMGSRLATAARSIRGVEICAVVDSDEVRGAELARAHDAAYFADVGQLVASGSIDAAYVAVPHGAHAAVATVLLDAGVHVLIDKPLAETESEALAILAARDRSGAALMVGFSHRFTAQLRHAKHVVDSGELGDLVVISDLIVEGITGVPAWYWGPGGGGVLQLQAHHSFDRLAWLLSSPIVEVSGREIPVLSAETGGAAALTVRFESGVLGTIGLGLQGAYAASPLAQIVLQGTHGVMRVETWRSIEIETRHRRERVESTRDDWLAAELEEFVAALQSGRPPAVGGEEGLAALRCAVAARESARTQVPVSVVATPSTPSR